ncbi:YitT family protein [Neolewinella lacunae]|uniref:YitT family protein n=1 Tax=Neolewinella lacunae TaxID=1517758 RepID=A0A923PMC5_9BACT|nr:YitT family protein [Neolewinella lacunae]MBC6996089.1 YitT family protein [Neolewinella lacunae]MDN3633942.1 YitT family protein [Neolewinella lacunae]
MPTPQTLRTSLTDAFFIIVGVLCAAFSLEGFLLPNAFIDGGVTGICLLITGVTGWPLPVLLVVVNIPFLVLANSVVGPRFALKTGLAIALLAAVILFVHFPQLTQDKLLVSVFGGFFLGAGIGLSMRGGSVLDGTEVLAIFLSRRLGAKVSDWVIIINVAIFSVAAMLLSIEQSLYSLLTYIVASKALDFIVDGVEEYTGVTIISPQSEDIRIALIEEVGCGVTIINGQGGFGARGELKELDLLYVVVTRLEIHKLTTVVRHRDPKAFITMSSINDVYGGMVKKRNAVG